MKEQIHDCINQKKHKLISLPEDYSHPDDKIFLDCISATFKDKESLKHLRTYLVVDGVVRPKEDLDEITPIDSDKNLKQFLSRIINKLKCESFFVYISRLSHDSPAIWPYLTYFKSLIPAHNINEYSYFIDCFFGHYNKTPSLIHLDDQNVMHFSKIGTKNFCLWDFETFANLSKDQINENKFQHIENCEIRYDLSPEHCLCWTTNWWHTAVPDINPSFTYSFNWEPVAPEIKKKKIISYLPPIVTKKQSDFGINQTYILSPIADITFVEDNQSMFLHVLGHNKKFLTPSPEGEHFIKSILNDKKTIDCLEAKKKLSSFDFIIFCKIMRFLDLCHALEKAD